MPKLIYSNLNFNKQTLLDITTLNKYDSQGMHKFYDKWPMLAKESYKSNLDICDFNDVDTIVFAGMGGSGSLGDIFSSILSKTSKHVYVVKGYHLPNSLSKNSLIVTTSVSGNTNETLAILESAKKISKKIIGFSSGGLMKDYCDKNKIEHRNIQQIHSPRTSFIPFLYSIIRVLGPILSIKTEDIEDSILQLEILAKKINSSNLTLTNGALELANWITDIPLIYYPWGLQAAAIRFKNSLQENAKSHAMVEDVIEASHNGIVSWERSSNIKPILLEGEDDHIKTKERWKILKEYFELNKIDYREFFSVKGNILSKLTNMIYFLDYTTIYRAVLSKTDPNPVSSIDFVKNRLKDK